MPIYNVASQHPLRLTIDFSRH